MSAQHAALARRMAWRRAKGELASMLETFGVYGENAPPPPKHLMDEETARYTRCEKALAEFIKKVEGEGLFE